MKTPKVGREVMAAIGRETTPAVRRHRRRGRAESPAETLRRLETAVRAGSTDEPMPPARPSSMEQHPRRDDGSNNGGETHENRSVGACLRRAFALLALGSLRDASVELLPVGLAPA
jgi:hypothetical protein